MFLPSNQLRLKLITALVRVGSPIYQRSMRERSRSCQMEMPALRLLWPEPSKSASRLPSWATMFYFNAFSIKEMILVNLFCALPKLVRWFIHSMSKTYQKAEQAELAQLGTTGWHGCPGDVCKRR